MQLINLKNTTGLCALLTLCVSHVSAQCLLPSDANTLATNFGKLISGYSELNVPVQINQR